MSNFHGASQRSGLFDSGQPKGASAWAFECRYKLMEHASWGWVGGGGGGGGDYDITGPDKGKFRSSLPQEWFHC